LSLEALEDRCVPTTLTVGPEIDVSPFPYNQAEESIAINTKNPQNIFAVSINSNRNLGQASTGLYGAISLGGGATDEWGGGLIATGADGGDGLPRALGDPKVAFSQSGNLFLTYLTNGDVWAGKSSEIAANVPDRLLKLRDANSLGKWTPGEWANATVTVIFRAPGQQPAVVKRTILSNTTDTLTVDKPWDKNFVPDDNSTFTIAPTGGRTIVVAMSADGGQSFQLVTNSVAPSANDLDYPSIAVGPGPGPRQTAIKESLWMSYRTTTGVFATGVALDNQGKIASRWSAPELIPGSLLGSVPDIKVGPLGQVAVVYEQLPLGQRGRETLFVSTDPGGLGGNSHFGTPVAVTTTGVYFDAPMPANGPRGITAQPNLAWDLSGKYRNTWDGRLYLVYTDTSGHTGALDSDHPFTDIFVMSSDDSGQHWSNPLLVNDPVPSTSRFFPNIAIDQKTGYVAFAWYDTRATLDNIGTYIYATISVDGGQTTLADRQLTQFLSDATKANNSQAGTSTGQNGANTLNDAGQTWVVGQWWNQAVVVTYPDQSTETRFITGNTATQLTLSQNWTVIPGNTATYQIGSEYRFGYGDYIGLDFVNGTFRVAWVDNSDPLEDNLLFPRHPHC
jgi:hypothetical protein